MLKITHRRYCRIVNGGALALMILTSSVLHAEECQAYDYEIVTLGCQNGDITSIDVGDVDSDGNDDIVYCCRIESAVTLLRAQDKDQTHYDRIDVASYGRVAPFPIQVLFADIDQDGRTDVFVTGGPRPVGSGNFPTQQVWFRNPGGSPLSGAWEMRVVRTGIQPKGFFLDVTGDGFPDLLPEFVGTTSFQVLVNPGTTASSWVARTIPSTLTDPVLWIPAELDGDPGTISFLGAVSPGSNTAPYASDIIRATMTGDLQFEFTRFPKAPEWNLGYYQRLNIGDFDGDGIDEFLSTTASTSPNSVSMIRVPQDGASTALGTEPLFTINSLDSDILVPALLNNDSIPDIAMSRVNVASQLNLASAPGVFPSSPTCTVLDERLARGGEPPTRLRMLGDAPQRILVPGYGIAYPTTSGVDLRIVLNDQTTSGYQQGQLSHGMMTVTNNGTEPIPASEVLLWPATPSHSLEKRSIAFPALAPAESVTLPFFFTVGATAECEASISGSAAVLVEGLRTAEVGYGAHVGRDINADRTYSDSPDASVPDGTGTGLQRLIVTAPLVPPYTRCRMAAQVSTTVGNRLTIKVFDERGVPSTLFDGLSEATTLDVDAEISSPTGLEDGGAFTISVKDTTAASPAILESWSVSIERPRTECVSPNQAQVVARLLGMAPTGSATDANLDRAFDAADLPIVFPD